MSSEQIAKILEAFNGPTDKYRRAEVDEAVALQEQITPWLLAVLDELVANPEKFDDEHTLLHMYAVSLLAHFKEPKAHLPIIRAFNLSPKIEYGLWAEMTTELLPALLFQTCGGMVDALKELVLDATSFAIEQCVKEKTPEPQQVPGFLYRGWTGLERPKEGSIRDQRRSSGQRFRRLCAVGSDNGDREPETSGSKGVSTEEERDALKHALDALDGGDVAAVRAVLRGLTKAEVRS